MVFDAVRVFQGTDSDFQYSTGNTLPLAGRPYAMTHWSIETSDDVRFFSPRSHAFHGVRATHQPSPWIGDYGSFLMLPQVGERRLARAEREGVFDPRSLVFSPAGFRLDFTRFQTRVELAAAARSAILRVTFPPDHAPKRLIFDLRDPAGGFLADGAGRFHGFCANHQGGVPENFRFHFVVDAVAASAGSGCADGVGWIEFPADSRTVELRIGTSFIDAAQAARNLGELSASFDATLAATRRCWEEKLGQIQIEAPEAVRQTFYSCFYRTLCFPREFHEFGADGNPVHYSPYDGGVHAGVLYADNGFWDTHRTVYPLLSLLDPARYEEMLTGWLHAAQEGGWFPRWSSPGYRSCMTGTHIDAVFADAAMKNIGSEELHREAFRYLRKNAEIPVGDAGLFGRRGLAAYLRCGYIPDEVCEHAAARTMDFCANDFALSQIAGRLGDSALQRELLRRSGFYRNLWNPAARLLQRRRRDGSFPEIALNSWDRGYIEGSSWQCAFAVPHDPAGLIAFYGGADGMVRKLDEMLAAAPDFEVGFYGREIHEMAEMALADFGQYGQCNQPAHHILWLYSLCGRRDRAAELIRRVAETLYSPETFPGDEDNGEMSGWYLFANFGLYPFCPGRAEYVLADPLHPMAITLADGRVLRLHPGMWRDDRIGHCALLDLADQRVVTR